ncbi:hypothetical protein [Serratia entomophila]|uniref:hypothetical protein n=1 Tax=Serratia entomophila TaxID=42906 RepID=UPI0021B7CC70|nr:hypothetical protein [Serratia entomophila]
MAMINKQIGNSVDGALPVADEDILMSLLCIAPKPWENDRNTDVGSVNEMTKICLRKACEAVKSAVVWRAVSENGQKVRIYLRIVWILNW